MMPFVLSHKPLRRYSIIGVWDAGWDEAARAEMYVGEVMLRIGSSCRSNTSVPEFKREDLADDAQTVVLELAFNNIVRNGLPFKNSSSLVSIVTGHGVLIRTFNLAYKNDFDRLSKIVSEKKLVKDHEPGFRAQSNKGADALGGDRCPSFGIGLDLVFLMTKESDGGISHISVRRFPVPVHLRSDVEQFTFPSNIPVADREIVGVRVLALIPYLRYKMHE